ncbi:MAG: hypothetical protein B6U85_09995 [Desulfurococcales archaeon ex4484_42]|nr:MAG: hypothetical protein B6U85_09995 [Desulfurococcales archaeon ex4484_42]
MILTAISPLRKVHELFTVVNNVQVFYTKVIYCLSKSNKNVELCRLGDGTRSYRSKLEIIISILKSIESSGMLKKTHILYRANLSSSQLNKYLNMLIDSGTVAKVKESDGDYYILTGLGRLLLYEIEKAIDVLNVKDKVRPQLEDLIEGILRKRRMKYFKNHVIRGVTGLQHFFKFIIVNKEGEQVAIEIIKGNELSMFYQLMSFYLRVADSKVRGIVIVPEDLASTIQLIKRNLIDETKVILDVVLFLSKESFKYDLINVIEHRGFYLK